jgi:hypothetical protein
MKLEAKLSTLESQLKSQTKSWEIQWDELTFDSVIGAGNFGEVHRGLWRGSAVAIKALPGNQDKNLQELLIMQYFFFPSLIIYSNHQNNKIK